MVSELQDRKSVEQRVLQVVYPYLLPNLDHHDARPLDNMDAYKIGTATPNNPRRRHQCLFGNVSLFSLVVLLGYYYQDTHTHTGSSSWL